MLDLRTTDHASATVVSVAGEVDRDVAGELRSALLAAAEHGRARLLVDMCAVEFLDSAGLAALVGVHRSLGVHQRLGLANVPVRMRRVLHDTAMTSLMDVHTAGEPWPWPQVPEAVCPRSS